MKAFTQKECNSQSKDSGVSGRVILKEIWPSKYGLAVLRVIAHQMQVMIIIGVIQREGKKV